MLFRYVEANALRAGLAQRAGEWPWSSDALRATRLGQDLLCDWPVDRPGNWRKILEESLPENQMESVRTSIARGRPFGSEEWVRKTADRLDLAFTIRSRGRPRKNEK